MLVECGIEIDEIGEEASCCDLAGEFVKVVVEPVVLAMDTDWKKLCRNDCQKPR